MTFQLPAIHTLLNTIFDRDMNSSPPTVSQSRRATISLLVPPLIRRARSNSSISRPDTPLSSIPPSLSHSPTTSTQSSCSTSESRRTFHAVVPLLSPYLQSQDLLSLTSVTPQCRDKLAEKAFESYFRGNGWDFDAMARRVQPRKDHKSRVWLSLAKSAIRRDQIVALYDSLPKQSTVKLPDLDKHQKKSVERLLRILLDIVTEHDKHNFSKLESLAKLKHLSFVGFVAQIPAYNWKLRYLKTFVVAAYVHCQTSYIKDDDDLTALAQTLSFEEDESPLLNATQVNFIYTFGCFTNPTLSHCSITSADYDPPHISLSHGQGTKLPGVRQAVDRFKTSRILLKGFYRKVTGETSPMTLDIEPQGLAKKSALSFLDRSIITMNATVSDEDRFWKMEGTINQETGTGVMKTGVTYKLSIVPWGVVGEKIHTDSCRHLGYFVLQWAKGDKQ